MLPRTGGGGEAQGSAGALTEPPCASGITCLHHVAARGDGAALQGCDRAAHARTRGRSWRARPLVWRRAPSVRRVQGGRRGAARRGRPSAASAVGRHRRGVRRRRAIGAPEPARDTLWGVAFASAPAIMPLSAGRRGWRGAARHDAAWCMADAPVKLPAARRCDASRRAAVSCNPARQPWQSGVPRRWMRAEDLGVVGAGFRDQGWRGGREGAWGARGTCLWRRTSRLGGRGSRFPSLRASAAGCAPFPDSRAGRTPVHG